MAPSAVNFQRITLRIEELDCAEEVLILQRELERFPEIKQLDFDVINHRMHVEFDAEHCSIEKIIGEISRVGMHARPWEEGAAQDSDKNRKRGRRLALTTVCGMSILVAFAIHARSANSLAAAFGHGAGIESQVPLLAKVLYGMAVLIGMWFVAPKAWGALRRRSADMNLLMTIAVVGAIGLGEWFEASVVAFLFSVALTLEDWSLSRTRRAIASLLETCPQQARCRLPDGSDIEKNAEDVSVGDIVIVRPGEKVPLDGTVCEGTSLVSQAPITGESTPVLKESGKEVFAGSINGDAMLAFEVTHRYSDTTLAHMIHLVEEAQSRQAPVEQWVQRFARYYTPLMILLAIGIAVLPPLFSAAAWNDSMYNAMVLLVIACPCALVISTPVTIVSALTSAARAGVLIKGGRFLEAVAGVRAVAMDKTGTLTLGTPTVDRIEPFDLHTQEEVLTRAVALEKYSNHPIAQAIVQHGEKAGIAASESKNHQTFAGHGEEAMFDDRKFWIGSQRFLNTRAANTDRLESQVAEFENTGGSVVAVGCEDHVCGVISLSDTVREGATAAIVALRKLGIERVCMLTGDNSRTAEAVASVVGVDNFSAEQMPEDKVKQVESLREQYGSVAMIGDGVNDAPALAAATVGIAMGAIGSDAAIETADIALMSDDLSRIPWLISHTRRALSVIKQNVAFALGLKIMFVVLTSLGLGSLWMAIAADTGASILVIFNGMRLLRADY